jgi:hypothetical protein
MDEIIAKANEIFTPEWFSAVKGEVWTIEIGGPGPDGLTCDFAGFGETIGLAKDMIMKHMQHRIDTGEALEEE